MSEIEQYQGDGRNPATDSWVGMLVPVGDLAAQIAHTEFVPASLRGKDGAKVAAAILTGRELGLPPMTALSSIHVINGKPGISAEMMRALVSQAGHEIVFEEVTTQRVKMKGRRDGSTEWTTITWTAEDAKRAGLTGNQTYTKYPRQMLTARATTELCRLIFADVIHGLRSLEELEFFGDDEIPESVAAGGESAPAATPSAPVSRRRKPVKSQPVDEGRPAPSEQAAPQQRRSPSLTQRGSASTDDAAPGSTGSGSRGSTGQPSGAVSPDPDAATPSGDQVAEGGNSVGGSDANLTSTSEPSPPPADDPAPLPEDEAPPADDEPVEGEVVDNAAPGTISQGQQKAMHAQFNRLGKQPREHRLIATRALIGRDVESSNDLSYDEAQLLLTALESCRKWNDLAAMAEDAEKVRNSTDGTGA